MEARRIKLDAFKERFIVPPKIKRMTINDRLFDDEFSAHDFVCGNCDELIVGNLSGRILSIQFDKSVLLECVCGNPKCGYFNYAALKLGS